jgi:putative membrane protein
MAYLWTKTFHLVFVIAWMATIFYLPRLLVNLAEAGDHPEVRARLVLMGQRLYRFGHHMFGLAVVFGLVLWFYFDIAGAWLHAKLALVAILLAYFIVCGRMIKRAATDGVTRSATWFRWFNELPLVVLIGVVLLALGKPF